MKISTRGRYALQMLIDLAQHTGDGYVSLKDIAARQNISKKYLEQIVSVLNKGRLLHTNRGYQGGYMLAVSPDKCSVGMVLSITEGPLKLDAGASDPDDPCQFIWQELNGEIDRYLSGITIQDIVDKLYESYSNDYII